MKNYLCESWAGWFVVTIGNKRKARSEAVREFGRGCIKAVREATKGEMEYFVSLKGERALIP